jgi:hypothetical protein
MNGGVESRGKGGEGDGYLRERRWRG